MRSRLEAVHPVLMSRDVPRSLQFYGRLGFTLAFQDPTSGGNYVGVRRDGVELHLQWNDPSDWDPPRDRPVYRFLVEDVDVLFEDLRSGGLLGPEARVANTPWGTREFDMLDPDGNVLQFYQSARP